ncbi:MAG: hypothetical protein ACKVOO_12560 [Burkholderiaceae bacterium]
MTTIWGQLMVLTRDKSVVFDGAFEKCCHRQFRRPADCQNIGQGCRHHRRKPKGKQLE